MGYKIFHAASLFLKRNKTLTLKASILYLHVCVYIYTDTSRFPLCWTHGWIFFF